MPAVEIVRAHLLISGRVQGVFFRACTEEEARRLGVTGWVRNLRNGQVEVVCEGKRNNVEQLIEWCRKGPPGASVGDVEIKWESATGEFRDFVISYGN